jgi:hypothetical protein
MCVRLHRGRVAAWSSRPSTGDKARLYGRVLVLLGIRNELQALRVPAWRQERNRIEMDRALAELAQH